MNPREMNEDNHVTQSEGGNADLGLIHHPLVVRENFLVLRETASGGERRSSFVHEAGRELHPDICLSPACTHASKSLQTDRASKKMKLGIRRT